MSHAPGIVSTEPLPGTLALPGTLMNPFATPGLELIPRAVSISPRQATAPHQHFAHDHETALPIELQVTAIQPPPSSQQSSSRATATGHDLPAQIEQLRNDIFGIAMNVSALNDRLDRLEQRVPPAGQSMQAGLATLRGEIETWLESHLNAAVEHCMHQIISRQNSSASLPVN